jgi:hypothetical protein
MTTNVGSDSAATPSIPALPSVKARQQAVWATGDFAVIGTTLQIVGEMLTEAVDVCAGERGLDVGLNSWRQ